MNTPSQVVSMENLFQLAGINYNDLPENTGINIEEKNIKIKSYNHKTNEVEFKQIIRLNRKQNSEMYKVLCDDFNFKATPEHKIYTKEFGYIELKDIKSECHAMIDTGEFKKIVITKLDGIFPVLDMSVEGNENYFSEKILSHNSPEKIGVGEAMKFFASIRIKTSKTEQQKDDGEEGQSSIDVVMSVFKNKVGVPFRKAQFTLLTGFEGRYGIDTTKEVIDFAIKYDVIKKAGSWYSYGEERIGQGINNVRKYFENNDQLFQSIKSMIIEKLKEEREKAVQIEDSFSSKMQEIAEESKPKRRGKKDDIPTETVDMETGEIKEAEIVTEE